MPNASAFREEALLKGRSGSKFQTWPLLTHSDLIQQIAEGYKLPSGATPELRAKVDRAKLVAAHGLAKSTGMQYARV